MADLQPIFDTILSGAGTVQTETWINLGLIPTDKQIFFGFATFIAEDKVSSFELRSNIATQSTGTVANTTLHDYSSAQVGSSVDRDLYRNGYTNTISIVSTGVEHWWLRVKAKGSVVGAIDYIIFYTLF